MTMGGGIIINKNVYQLVRRMAHCSPLIDMLTHKHTHTLQSHSLQKFCLVALAKSVDVRCTADNGIDKTVKGKLQQYLVPLDKQ